MSSQRRKGVGFLSTYADDKLKRKFVFIAETAGKGNMSAELTAMVEERVERFEEEFGKIILKKVERHRGRKKQ